MRLTVGLYQRGFSVLDLVLIVTLLLAVAAVCVPTSPREEPSREARDASIECRVIANALRDYESDTGFRPCGMCGMNTFSWLRGPGNDPEFNEHPEGKSSELNWFIVADKMGAREKWGGPYVDELVPDPWGRRYVVLLKTNEENDGSRTWVVSAGPDGVIETRSSDTLAAGDDIGEFLPN